MDKFLSDWHTHGFLSYHHPFFLSYSDFFNPMESMSKRVLVVEDEVFWRILIEHASKKIDKGIELFFASDAESALNSIHENGCFDFIVVDHLLEGTKSGFDFLDDLSKESSVKERTSFLLMSGMDREEMKRIIGTRFDGDQSSHFAEKPDTLKDLVGLLRNFFSHEMDQKKGLSKLMSPKGASGDERWPLPLSISTSLILSSLVYPEQLMEGLKALYVRFFSRDKN